MAEVEPFAAIRYTTEEVSHLIAPPYDILTQADKTSLLEKDDHNIVAIDLPHVPPKSAGPPAVYERAAGELTSWLDIRALARDELDAFYVYHQSYQLGSKALTRKMFFCRLRLEAFGEGGIYAHEETFGGPKEDRLKLTTSTRCNLSPIFGLYPDPQNEISAMFETVLTSTPHQSGVLDGVQNKMWVVTDEDLLSAVRGLMADRPIFIADGHHRYSTALIYRDQEIEEAGDVAPTDPINYVLAVLCGMEDPGATIQPYFRTIIPPAGLTAAKLQGALLPVFDWTVVPKPASGSALAELLRKAGPQAMAFYFAGENLCTVLNPKSPDLLAAFEPARHLVWRSLPYAILHRYIIDEVLKGQFGRGKTPAIHYHKSMEEAVRDAKTESGIAALMPATTMNQLRDLCMAGELMPQKSTYFYPKLATGLVINPLY